MKKQRSVKICKRSKKQQCKWRKTNKQNKRKRSQSKWRNQRFKYKDIQNNKSNISL